MTYKKQKKIEIPVTQPYLPPKSEYEAFVNSIWERNWLTNNGPLTRELEERLQKYLELDGIACVTNGTIALQIAIKSLQLSGEIITTPFSYVATTSSIIWEGCQPVFVDIDPETWNLNPDNITAAVTDRTSAIIATHVFGIPCNTGAIRELADRHNLKIIYDAAHAFGTRYKGRSLYRFGDISTASFHATKLFHTIEGGALMAGDSGLIERSQYMRNFGHDGPWKFNGVGINGKLSEFHAAMGLVNLDYVDLVLEKREKQCGLYDRYFNATGLTITRPRIPTDCDYNYSYYPVLFESEEQVLQVQEKLKQLRIQTRRYFYPLLNELDYVDGTDMDILPVARDVSRRILCLPLYHELNEEEIETICNAIKVAVRS